MSRICGKLLVASAALTLCACGGGEGGTYLALPPPPIPTPTPSPTPTPTPTPTATGTSPAIFAGVTTNTNFSVVGWASDFSSYSLARDDFAVRYDAASQNYIVTLPGRSPNAFISSAENSSFWNANLDGSPGSFSIFKPRATNPDIQLTYTSFGSYAFPCSDVGYTCDDFGIFAFGTATPGSGVPVTGAAIYNAYVVGRTLDNAGYSVGGSATLQFDFGAGTLGGHFDPMIGDIGLGRYDFVSTVFGVGSTTFSGAMSYSGTNAGAFNGIFTGPTAQEMMARWNASYLNPSTQQSGQMSGVWVGKKN